MAAGYKLLDPLSLPQVSLGELARSPAAAVWLEPGTSRRRYFRRPPFAHYDPDNARIFADLGSVEIPYPPAFAASLTNTTLIGFRTLLKDGAFLLDEVMSDAAAIERHLQRLESPDEHRNERTGLRRREGSDEFLLNERTDDPIRIEPLTVLLSSDEPENYGSFLFRVLPKIVFCRYFAGDCKILVPLPYKSMARLLEICGVEPSQIIVHDTRKVYQLDRVVLPSARNPHAFLDEVTIGLLTEIRTKVAPGSGAKGELIFVSRQNLGSTKAGYRAMENEAELRASLERLGFTTIFPETMSADEQIAAFASAAVVVGQSGGAMFNVAFCRPGTIVIDIESEPHWIHAHMSYFSSLNLRYIIFEAKPLPQADRTIHLPFRVNVAALQSALQSILDNNLHATTRRS